jgi:hypothetical protein
VVVAAIVASAGGVGLAGTAAPQALPVVSIAGATDGSADAPLPVCLVAIDRADINIIPIVVTFQRDQTVGALTVPIEVGLDPDPIGSPLPTSASFADGAATTTVSFPVGYARIGTTTATITVLPGPGYTVGDPASADADYVVTETVDLIGCEDAAAAPAAADPGSRVLARTG